MNEITPVPVTNPDLTQLTALCREYINTVSTEKHSDEELEHYIFEVAMEAVFGKKIFDYINKVIE